MSKSLHAFNNIYGVKPLFGGVYTTKPVEEMCKEAKLFMENGIHVYLESLRFRDNARSFEDDKKAINTVLKYIADDAFLKHEKIISKIGVNFLFKPSEAYRLAKKYNLPFVINDAIVGEYSHKKGCSDENNSRTLTRKHNTPSINLFAGITPGYLINKTPGHQWYSQMQRLNGMANVILVGDRPCQNALEQIIEHKKDFRITKPIIAAQGVNVKNIKEILLHADGAFIGSGFRNKDGLVSLELIKEIKKLSEEIIK